MFGEVLSFAAFMVNQRCDLDLSVGVHVMNNPVEIGDKFKLIAKIGDTLFANGSEIFDLEKVVFELSPVTAQSVIESRNQNFTFKDGGCKGRRITKRGSLIASIEVQGDSLQEIRVVGAWATSYNSGVKMTNDYIFYYKPIPSVAEL